MVAVLVVADEACLADKRVGRVAACVDSSAQDLVEDDTVHDKTQ